MWWMLMRTNKNGNLSKNIVGHSSELHFMRNFRNNLLLWFNSATVINCVPIDSNMVAIKIKIPEFCGTVSFSIVAIKLIYFFKYALTSCSMVSRVFFPSRNECVTIWQNNSTEFYELIIWISRNLIGNMIGIYDLVYLIVLEF